MCAKFHTFATLVLPYACAYSWRITYRIQYNDIIPYTYWLFSYYDFHHLGGCSRTEWPQTMKRRTRINLIFYFLFFSRSSYKGKLVAAELVLRARAPNLAVVCIIFAVGPDRDPLAGRKLHPPCRCKCVCSVYVYVCVICRGGGTVSGMTCDLEEDQWKYTFSLSCAVYCYVYVEHFL